MIIERAKKFVGNLHDKKDYTIHIRNLKDVFNQGLMLRKKCRVSSNSVQKLD